MGFDYQPTLNGTEITIRPMVFGDYGELYLCACDPRIWAGHPSKDRYKKDAFDAWFEIALREKALVFLENNSNCIIGSSRYYTVETDPNDISIGYTFLATQFWGGAVNKSVKQLMLTHAFNYFDRVWFHVDPSNLRSQAATKKIGAIYVRDEINKLSGEEKHWKCYSISKTDWISI